MSDLAALLARHELLLLLVVVVLGLWVARLRVGNVQVGIAGVLFVGLGLTAWIASTGAKVEPILQLKEFGLVVFVYCVGLSSGAGFLSAFRERGIKLNLSLVFALACGSAVAVVGGQLLGLRRGLIAGVFCGSLTNTPALGAATDILRDTQEAIDPVLGYSITYPFGVLGALIVFRVFALALGQAFTAEKEARAPESQTQIASATCVVSNGEIIDHPIGELQVYTKTGVIISRVQRGVAQLVPTKYTQLCSGDLVTIVGSQHAVREAIAYFGEVSAIRIESDRQRVDMRRILVSKRNLAGCTIRELELDRKFNAQVTRLRRADVELVPSPTLRIELGDRLRVVAPRERLKEIGVFFGDSERELAEIDFVALSLGISAGLLVGLIPVWIFGTKVSLGAAGGPLVLALVLGRLGKTGPLNWTLPYEVNHALRELGLLLFLAGVGVSAGGAIGQIKGREGLAMLGLGALVTIVTSLATLVCARRFARASVITSIGITSGMQTQPATLAAAYELSEKSDETYIAYALVYPVAMIGKIVLAQLIAALS
jgi:putative transport protein